MLSALARLTQSLSRMAVALILGLSLLLTACSGDAEARLTGDYVEDTVAVSRSLLEVIDLPQDDENHAEAEAEAAAKAQVEAEAAAKAQAEAEAEAVKL